VRAVDRRCDEVTHRRARWERERRVCVAPLDVLEVRREQRVPVQLVESERLPGLARRIDQLPELRKIVLAIAGRDEPAGRPENACGLGDCTPHVRDVVEHPTGKGAVEVVVRKRKLFGIGDLRVDAPGLRELDHARRDVDCAHVGAELLCETLRDLAGTAADVENPLRARFGSCSERELLRILAVDERAEDLVALHETLLARVLPANEQRVVELHALRIGWPGIPREGDLPPSHAFTVAPTSANSPSWICPAALRPVTYASKSAYSRE
jgi:hypothetical protein